MSSGGHIIDHPRVRAWLEVREALERQLEPLGQATIAALGLMPGERVLDVGCGIGRTPWALQRAVGPRGQVIGLELLQAAVDVVRGDAELPANVAILCGDAQDYPFEAGAFDAVFSRFGVMFFADPVTAFRNLRRALRPGGRLGFVCWRGLEDNDLDATPLRLAASALPPDLVEGTRAAGWFSFSDGRRLQATLADAGFVDIVVAARDEHVGTGDLRSTVEVCARVGALGAILRERPELRPPAVAALEDGLRALDGPGGPRLRAATWVVLARAPD